MRAIVRRYSGYISIHGAICDRTQTSGAYSISYVFESISHLGTTCRIYLQICLCRSHLLNHVRRSYLATMETETGPRQDQTRRWPVSSFADQEQKFHCRRTARQGYQRTKPKQYKAWGSEDGDQKHSADQSRFGRSGLDSGTQENTGRQRIRTD